MASGIEIKNDLFKVFEKAASSDVAFFIFCSFSFFGSIFLVPPRMLRKLFRLRE
jgi:hypothetical protein